MRQYKFITWLFLSVTSDLTECLRHVSVGFDQCRLVNNITLLKAEEVDQILAGHDEKFRVQSAIVPDAMSRCVFPVHQNRADDCISFYYPFPWYLVETRVSDLDATHLGCHRFLPAVTTWTRCRVRRLSTATASCAKRSAPTPLGTTLPRVTHHNLP